jgi:hypothetical protein
LLSRSKTALVVIYSAAILHIAEALIVADTTAADNSIPIASLSAAFFGHRVCLEIAMVGGALLAVVAAIRPGPLAIFALIPQQTLLMITAIGAIAFAAMGHYADGYEPVGGGWFIFADQLPRVLFAIAHGVAFYQWLWFTDLPQKKRNTVESILAQASRISFGQGEVDDDLLVIPTDELREIVEAHL